MENFIELLYSRFLLSDGVSTDTRTIQPGNLFFALSGPNFNGNIYAEEALKKGAAYVVVDDPQFVRNDRYILAENSLEALQALSKFHRSRFKKPVFALTGSNGKTSTKELISRVLGKKYDVLATEGNFNNHIGVPLTLLKIHPQVEIAIVEMGASKVGDIAELCDFANPTHGLITNIGHAHTNTFGGIEGVLRGKSELFDHLRKTGGHPFINELDPRLINMAKRFAEKTTYPAKDLELVNEENPLSFSLDGTDHQSSLYGAYNFPNIAAAVAVGRYFEVPDGQVTEAICEYAPDNLRSQVVEKGQARIIVDAYNANPDSMLAALETLNKVAGQKWVVLGDMLELENESSAHAQLGEKIAEMGFDQVMLVGELMKHAADQIDGAQHFDHVDELKSHVRTLEPGTAHILLKGSRKMKLEQLLEHFKE
ncbi:MAG: UDP-N-acetylmuramoyl-tripeptide--D-alanyl-D-alanine ligase [Cytophagales bacterium]|nr:UDP-N-acetylmuramoyl-tripeptide--D-alanyl-D-alanine ligase [Cytophagales bacterium]